MNNKAVIRNIICVVVSAVLVVWLVFMIRAENRKMEVQTTTIEAAKEKAYPYEKELRQLKSDMQALLDGTAYASDRAEIMVGFVPSGVDDISYIREQSQEYGFMPVVVLDCTMDKDIVESIIERKDSSWELMLYASNFSAETNKSVQSVLDYLNDNERDYTGVFFLRNDYKTSENVALLKDDGFIGYTIYNSESPKSGQLDDGTIHFDYSYLTSASTSVETRLAASYANKASIIVVIDMDAIDSGKLSNEYLTSLFKALQTYAEYDDCSFAMIADVVDELSEVNSIEEDNMEKYEKQAEGMQERIDELEETISNIYDGIEY